MKILITGGAGFIGGHLASDLASKNISIDLVDNMSRGIEDPFLANLKKMKNVRFLPMDILDQKEFNKLDNDYNIIFHLAAIIGVRHVLERPYMVLEQNTIMTTNLIRFAQHQNKLERFLFASTSEVTAGSLKFLDIPVPTPESIPLALTELDSPRTSYMLSKIYGEALCIHSGLPYTIFRPHNVYGPRMGMVHVIPELLKKALDTPADGKLKVASPEHRRAFCHVHDATKQLVALAKTDAALNGTFNIGNQETECSIRELAGLILKITNRNDLDIEALPETSGSPPRRCPDMSHTSNITGFTPAICLEEGVKNTFEWYNTNVFSTNGISAI